MQRLFLAILIVAAAAGLVMFVLRATREDGRGPPQDERLPARSGAVPKLAFGALFLIIFGVTAGWLSGL